MAFSKVSGINLVCCIMDDLGDFIVFDTFFGRGSSGGSSSRRGGDNQGCGCLILVILSLFIYLMGVIFD